MSANNGEGEDVSSPRRPTHSPTLLRKGIPGERKPLKEKLITYYEQLFKVGAHRIFSSQNFLLERIFLLHPGRGSLSRESPFLGGVFPSQSEPLFLLMPVCCVMLYHHHQVNTQYFQKTMAEMDIQEMISLKVHRSFYVDCILGLCHRQLIRRL